MKVFVLDDEQKVIDSLARMLHDICDVDGTRNAKDAVHILQESDYDFIFVDYNMPDHDGKWFLKHATLPKKTKVLLLTGHINKHMVKDMFNLGISGYLAKPVHREEILTHLHYHSHGAENFVSEPVTIPAARQA